MSIPCPSSIPGFHYIILDASELKSHQCLEPLAGLINGAFPQSEGGNRIPSLPYLLDLLGVHGRCCVMFRSEDVEVKKNGVDDDKDAGVDIDMSRPVATTILKYFNPDLGFKPMKINGNEVAVEVSGYDHEPENILSIHHWEPTCVAIRANDPSLKGQGLAVECANRIESNLLDRLEQARQRQLRLQSQSQPNGTMNGGQELHLNMNMSSSALFFWIRTTAKTTGPYWQRRGYEVVDLTWYPKGEWRLPEDFQIMTLKKEVLRRVN